jgi:hypothetical protein
MSAAGDESPATPADAGNPVENPPENVRRKETRRAQRTSSSRARKSHPTSGSRDGVLGASSTSTIVVTVNYITNLLGWKPIPVEVIAVGASFVQWVLYIAITNSDLNWIDAYPYATCGEN